MKRVTVVLMATALILMGATALMAAGLPQALQGVDLASAQPLTNAQAQEIRGAAQPNTLPPGFAKANNGASTVDTSNLKGIGQADFSNEKNQPSPTRPFVHSRVFSNLPI